MPSFFCFKILSVYVLLFFHTNSYAEELSKVAQNELKNVHAFQALPLEQREKYMNLKQKASIAYQKGKFSTCLIKTFEAESVFDLDYEIYFWRGACYAGWHDTKNAAKLYRKALSNNPHDININLELFEIHFFSKDYKNCLQVGELLRTLYSKRGFPKDQIALVEFKLLMSMTRMLEKHPKLEEQISEMKQMYTFMDDTPYSYFVQALDLFQAGNKEKANRRINASLQIFGAPHTLIWIKALLDEGYIEYNSFAKVLALASNKK